MNASSINPVGYLPPPQPSVTAEEAAQRRQLTQAAKSVNESGVLGQNQLVFLLDRRTHRAIIRVEDRETHAVVSQIPPEYVLRLAQDLGASSDETTASLADM